MWHRRSPVPALVGLVAWLAAVLVITSRAGWSPSRVLVHHAFLAAFVVVPGWLWVARCAPRRDVVTTAFLAWVVGSAGLSLVYVATCVLDARGWTVVWPLASIAYFVVVARRSRRERDATGEHASREAASTDVATWPSWTDVVLLAIPVAAAMMRTRVESVDDWFLGTNSDDGFHAENAGQFARLWPLGDPRLAGEALRYHVLGYTPHAVIDALVGLPVRETLLGTGTFVAPTFLALGFFVAARSVGAASWLASIASTVTMLHVDLLEELGRYVGLDWRAHSYLAAGLYRSPSTAIGLTALIGLLLLLREHLAATERSTKRWVLLGAVAFLASGSKGSVMPPLWMGLGFVAVWSRFRGRASAPRAIEAWAVTFAASLPFTLWLTWSENSYARTMFHWAPARVQVFSPFQYSVASVFGRRAEELPVWAIVACAPLWWAGFLGVAVAGAIAWWRAPGRGRDASEGVWAVTFLAGFVPAYFLSAPGNSHVFFAYDSQVCLVFLGTLGLVRWIGSVRRRAWIVVVLATVSGIVQYDGSRRALAESTRPVLDVTGDPARYRAGLDWIRESLPNDAMLVVDDVRMGVGAWTERRLFFATDGFSPWAHSRHDPYAPVPPSTTEESPFRAQRDLQIRFFRRPTIEALAEVRRIAGDDVPLFAVRSNLHVSRPAGRFTCEVRDVEGVEEFASAIGARLVHDAGVLVVYELPARVDGAPTSDPGAPR